MKVAFEKFDRNIHVGNAPIADVIEHEYETGGPATHIGFNEQNSDIMFAFPMREDGTRFVAVVDAIEFQHMAKFSKTLLGVDEWDLEYSDEQLEEGIEAESSLF